MNLRTRVAALGAIALAAALALSLPAKSDEDAWSAAAVKARFPDPDAGAKPETFTATNIDCKDCHLDRVKSLATSFHAKFGDAGASKSRGCQECHGPGQAHADDEAAPMRDPIYAADLVGAAPTDAPAKEGEKPRKHVVVSVKEMNGVCLKCHLEVLTKPVLAHRAWTTTKNAPAPADRSCVSCHGVHLDKSLPAFDKKTGPFATAAELEKASAKPVDPALCVQCHSQFDAPVFHPKMARSGHAFLLKDDEESHGCQACHGAGSLHLLSGGRPETIVNPKKQKAADVVAACNACHLAGKAGENKSVEKWTCSEHSRQGVSCIVCHDANAPKGKTLRKPEFELCGACHLDVQAQFRLPNRHRVAEGRVTCSDCHDPHGNTNKVRDMDVRYRACLACHQEKGGPFLFDHGIKRTEGCVACHDPHGSTNRRMLTYPRMLALCLQCHPETPHDLKNDRSRFANCIGCHSEIHGSDLDRLFLK